MRHHALDFLSTATDRSNGTERNLRVPTVLEFALE